MNKKYCQMKHLQKRYLQRVGTFLDKSNHATIVNLITSGKSYGYYKQSNRVSVHTVLYNNKELTVVYDKQRKQCITVLPKKEENIL